MSGEKILFDTRTVNIYQLPKQDNNYNIIL